MRTERKSLLVLAPHPDDEINLAGELIVKFVQEKFDVKIIYITNGDAEVRIGNKRVIEAVLAAKELGLSESNLIFLGYANEWKGDKHIYNGELDELFTSKLGKKKTNLIGHYSEFCFTKEGEHHLFTRRNLLSDLKNVILEYKPDILVCTDYDSHSDHRAISLMFDLIMGELLYEDNDYRPLILKKYAYNGVWKGDKDFYRNPIPPTQKSGLKFYLNRNWDLDSPNFLWEDRMIFNDFHLSPYLWKNTLYKAAKKHSSTNAWYVMQRVINSDEVYWWRPTQNLLLLNDTLITVSSGEEHYLRDFMYYDSLNVLDRNDSLNFDNRAWGPESYDSEPCIKIQFSKTRYLNELRVFEGIQGDNRILKVKLVFDDSEQVIEFEETSSMCHRIFLDNKESSSIKIIIQKWYGTPMITEIEIYESIQDIKLYNDDIIHFCNTNNVLEEKYSFFTQLLRYVEKVMLDVKYVFKFKCQYEMTHLLNILRGDK